LAVYDEFGIDGIDIDWEYPGQVGASGNSVTRNDSANFLSFLRLLRTTLPAGAKMTAATQSQPFAGPDGNPMTDVYAFAVVLDWILLMNYDVWGCKRCFPPSHR
jgi:chitinase